MMVLVVIEAVVLALLALLVAGLLRSHAEILRTFHDMGVGRDPLAPPGATTPVQAPTLARAQGGTGAVAADIAGSTPSGDVVVVGVAGAAQPTLLAFLSSGCITCRDFWDTFARPRLDLPGGARLVIVTMGAEAESESAIARLAPADVMVVMSSEAWDEYEVPGSPYFAFVEAQTGRVAGQGTAPDWDQVLRLMTEATDDTALMAARAESDARTQRAERRKLDDRAREARADEILMAAGIYPGDPSLYAAPEPPAPAPAADDEVARLKGHDLGCTLPAGWDGRITVRGDGEPEAFRARGAAENQAVFTAVPQPVVHLANFGLPEERGDFGSGAVELMGTRDVFIVLFEYEPAAASTPLFASVGIPRTLAASAFDPTSLRKGIAGQTGFQAFFNEAGRAFSLYVVLGSAADRTRLVALVNSVLATVQIAPRADG